LRVPRKGESENVQIASHKLEDLFDAEVVRIHLAYKEEEALDDIENQVTWGGRYPIPGKKPEKEFIDCFVEFGEGTYEILNTIYHKIIAEFDQLLNEGTWFASDRLLENQRLEGRSPRNRFNKSRL
jgi:hypothetical protein